MGFRFENMMLYGYSPSGVKESEQVASGHESNFNSAVGYTVSVADHSSGQPEVMQQTTYYPFGYTLEQSNYYSLWSEMNKNLYSGKELQDDELGGVRLDWYDYGARFYDPAIARWTVIDNKAEKNYGSSLYVYAANNPIRFIGPDGNDWWDAVVGTAIGVAINIVHGSTSLRNSYTPTDAADYNNALRNTDAAAMAVGEGMVKGGGGTAASGLAVAVVAGTASLAVVDAPVTVPVAAGASVVAEDGAVTAVGGAVLMANGSANTAAGYNYGSKEKSDTKGESKRSLSGTKEALKDAKGKIGLEPNESLPKGEKAKFGRPQRGDSQKGYHLDPAHPNAKSDSGEEYSIMNYWDWTQGKRGSGGTSGAVPVKK